MKLTLRLVLAFALVALFAAGLSGWLAYQEASDHFRQVLENPPFINGSAPTRGIQRGARQAQVLTELQRSSLRASLLALSAAMVIGGYLAYQLLRPIRALTDATRLYGQGKRDARVSLLGNDELTEMGRTFNQVADQLAVEQERQKQLVADIAHELRTPLTVLQGELESMQDGLLEGTPETYGRLVDEVGLLTRLVQDLRLLSLADSGGLELHRDWIDVANLAEEALAAFRPKAERLGVGLINQAQSLTLGADQDRLMQVLYNLLENALRHTPTGGQITLRVREESGWGVLEVRNTGLSIPANDLNRIFDRFYRLDQARGRETGGSGLGLAIVRAIVQAHGGTVGAKNDPQGGVCFWIHLPIQTAIDFPRRDSLLG
ncbi:MAG: HAMP domain-containing protein [Thermaceae bacterium]|nr:HAMP domain-containing protein [Thermaceae bacterium]